MIDLDDNRLEVAKRFGATATINSTDGKAVEAVMKMTGKRGVDTAIEAVGIPATFELCEEIVAPGGTIANIGVHGKKVDLHLEQLWDRNISITTRLVDTVTIPMLFKTVGSHKIDPKLLITHRFKLDQILDAYETFGTRRQDKGAQGHHRGLAANTTAPSGFRTTTFERGPSHDLPKRQSRHGKLLKTFEELTDKELETKIAAAADLLRDLAAQDLCRAGGHRRQGGGAAA